jgi:putative transcriptional regulator
LESWGRPTSLANLAQAELRARICTVEEGENIQFDAPQWFTLGVPPQKKIPLPHIDLLRQLLSSRRSESGLTYDQLATLSGVSRRTIISIENGTSPGSMETWGRLTRALDVGFDELFTAATGLTSLVSPNKGGSTPTMTMLPGNPLEAFELP